MRMLMIVLAALLLSACPEMPPKQSMWSKAPPPEPKLVRPVPARMLLLLPVDLRVHEISAGGVVEKVDAWSQKAAGTALDYLKAFDARDDGLTLVDLPALSAEEQATLEQHVALYDTVAYTAYAAQRSRDPVWRKRGEETDFTLGPGLNALAEKSGADAALLIIGSDYISTGGRKATLALTTFVGAMLGIGIAPQGGQAFVSAGVVDLHTGRLLWFDSHRSSDIDLNEAKGVRAVLDAVFRDYPRRPAGEVSDAKPR